MRYILKAAVAAAAIAAASPAFAGPPGGVSGGVVDACTALYVTNAVACQGYYGGNLFNDPVGANTPDDIKAALFALLNGTAATNDTSPTNNTSDYHPPYNIDYSKVLNIITSSSGNVDGSAFNYVFTGPSFSNYVIFGAHFGNQPDAGTENNISAFWLVNVGPNPTNTITITNGKGVSNAAIYGFGPAAVPEPATWAMMLLGFGAIGVSMRRRRRVPLAQLA
jgi:hypothetical protein